MTTYFTNNRKNDILHLRAVQLAAQAEGDVVKASAAGDAIDAELDEALEDTKRLARAFEGH